jgi:hypothetical protein
MVRAFLQRQRLLPVRSTVDAEEKAERRLYADHHLGAWRADTVVVNPDDFKRLEHTAL